MWKRSAGWRNAAAVLAVVVLVSGFFGRLPGAARPALAGASVKDGLLAQAARRAEVFRTPAVRPAARPARRRPVNVRGHIVAKFSSTMSSRLIARVADEIGATRVVRPSYADFDYVEIPADQDPVSAAEALARQAGVIYAEPDPIVYPDFVPSDPYYRYQWNFQKLGMDSAWEINQGGSSKITVAVLDTGVAYLDQGAFARAPDLAGTRFLAGYDFVWDDNAPVDMDGHGTHVTGTIAQTTNNSVGTAGMAFNVNILPVKVIYGDWDELYGAAWPYGLSTVARGVRFAIDSGAKVINMSFGAAGPNTPTLDALHYAVQHGAFVAVAAGNEALTGNDPMWPAVYAKDIEGVVAVAAVDYAFNRAPYSNIDDYVEIAAPGGNLSADLNGDGYADGVLQQTLDYTYVDQGIFNRFAYMFYSGTSMAAPHVTGLAALLMDQGITSPAAVEAAMKQFATDVGPAGRDSQTGYGVINPRGTLRGLGLAR
jgi:serine protease